MNAMGILAPYRYEGYWVFDDPAAGLRQEPFVLGIDTMIDRLVVEIADADRGFKLLFSPQPFPGVMASLKRRRAEFGGNWYWCPELEIEGRLCPALYRYFEEAPEMLYVRAEPRSAA